MDLMQLATWLTSLGQNREQTRQFDTNLSHQKDVLGTEKARLQELIREFDAQDPIRKASVAQTLAETIKSKLAAERAGIENKALPASLQAGLNATSAQTNQTLLGNYKSAAELAMENLMSPFIIKHGANADKEMAKHFQGTGDNKLTLKSIMGQNSGVFGGMDMFKAPQVDFSGANPYANEIKGLQDTIEQLQNAILGWGNK